MNFLHVWGLSDFFVLDVIQPDDVLHICVCEVMLVGYEKYAPTIWFRY